MELCVRMAKQLVLKKVEKGDYENLVLSPLSIDIVLNMVAAGSTGRTLEKMLSLLGSESIDEIKSQSLELMAIRVLDEPVMCLVNGAWFDKRFTPKLSYNDDVLKGIFCCEANMVDFSTQADEVVNEINAWAEAASRGLIKGFLQRGSLAPDTGLILANALYFKGCWKHGFNFDVNRTQNRTFYLLNGDTVSVPFMTSNNRNRRCRSLDGFQVLHIPYQSNSNSKRFSMYLFLPDERDGLQSLLEKLTLDAEYIHQYRALSEQTLDEFWIPKFKFSFDFDVSSTMEEMGVPLAFGENAEDFAEMVEIPKGLTVPRMFQKSFIEVDEKGTVAAATTLGLAFYSPGYQGNTTFVADHPFMFMIMEERSNLVIFTGAILDPSKGK